MTVGELKKLIAPIDDELIVKHYVNGDRVPVYAAQVYQEQKWLPDGKVLTVEMLDIS
jgi:hypothetical protein